LARVPDELALDELSAELRAVVTDTGGTMLEAPPGSSVIPRGTPHAWQNVGDGLLASSQP
jgi:hypothetical protein